MRIPGGTSTYSKQANRFPTGYPQKIVRAHGVKVFGDDGSIYVDYISGLGSILLGHGNPAVTEAVRKQIELGGPTFSLPAPIEEEAAESFCALTGWDMVRWCKNGSDATEAAVRMARYITGRTRIVTLGGYHGYHSDLVTSTDGKDGGILPSTMGSLTKMRWPFAYSGDWSAHLEYLEGGETACLIAEPISLECDFIPWVEIRKVLTKAGSLLIFDEMITGLRTKPIGIQPDLACYGKALGNGWPIACVAGPEAIMNEFGEHVFMSGTYSGEAVSLAAANAVCKYLLDHPEVPARLKRGNDRIKDAFNTGIYDGELEAKAVGYGGRSQFQFHWPKDREKFLLGCLRRGILFGADNFIQTEHTEEIIIATTDVIKQSLLKV